MKNRMVIYTATKVFRTAFKGAFAVGLGFSIGRNLGGFTNSILNDVVYDNILRFDEFYNARVMAWNEYLHAWGTFAICPFANAVVLATAQPKPATAISVSDVSVAKDATATVTVTLTPSDATTDLTYLSDNETVFTVSPLGVVTGVGAGNGTLTVKTDNGLSDTATVTVTGA